MKNSFQTIRKSLLAAALSVALLGCGQQQENSSSQETGNAVAETPKTSEDAMAFNAIIDAYIELKDALIASDAEQAKAAASQLEKSISSTNPTIKKIALNISEAEELEAQRKAFFELSQNMTTYIADNKPEKAELYQQYCPMAFGNTGAYWISNSKEVLNPYFGDKMLRCGKVEKQL